MDLLTEFTSIYLAVAFYAWWGVRGLHITYEEGR